MNPPLKRPKISDEENGLDRLSLLPEPVLDNIFSRIGIFDGIILCSVWKDIWIRRASVNLDFENFCNQKNLEMHEGMRENLANFINYVLLSQSRAQIVRFILSCGFLFNETTLSRWIAVVTKRSPKEIVLSMDLGVPFHLPISLTSCGSLEVLRICLSDGIFIPPSNDLGLLHLHTLHLEDVHFADQNLTNHLLSRHHLKKLVLVRCDVGDMTQIHIASTSLVYIAILNDNANKDAYANCVFKISCPVLAFFQYVAPLPKNLIAENLYSMGCLDIYFTDMGSSFHKIGRIMSRLIDQVPSTSVLKLCMMSLKGLCTVRWDSQVKFSRLKKLGLIIGGDEDCMLLMMSLLGSSPNLEVLRLFSDMDDDETEDWQMHDNDYICLESHLKSIQLVSFSGEQKEMELLKYFLKKARVLEKVTIFWENTADRSVETQAEVLSFPKISKNAVVTFLGARAWPKPEPPNWYDR